MLGKSELIGIDVGQYSVKIARIKQTAKNITATSLTYEIIPSEIREQRDDEALSKMIMAALKKQKIAKGQAVLHVNLGDVIMRNVVLENPKVSGMVLEGELELELGNAIPFGVDQVYYDYDEKPNKNGARTVVAVRRDVADRKANLLKDLPKTFTAPEVDVDAFAFSRLLEYVIKKEGAKGNIMIIDIGYMRSRFYVYNRDTDLLFSREQQFGGKNVNDIIRDVFDVNEETAENRKLSKDFTSAEYDDLVLGSYVHTFNEQLHLVMDFYEASEYGKEQISMIYLTGGGSRLSGLVESLNSLSSSIEIRALDLSSYIKLGNSSENRALQSGISHGLAIGLAVEI